MLTVLGALLLLVPATAQNLPETARQQAQQGGMSTGIAHAPVKDALSRPITAGGFVDGAPVVFADITHASGIDKFHHKSGTPEKTTILETPGSGVALLDYDNDVWPDIYVSNFGKNRLYHNNHDGTCSRMWQKKPA
jgi:enediyne biosynthesis protein E4